MNVREIHEYADTVNTNLLATDRRFNHMVTISLDDGSFHMVNSAFYEETSGWTLIFCEHDVPRIYETDMVNVITEWERVR